MLIHFLALLLLDILRNYSQMLQLLQAASPLETLQLKGPSEATSVFFFCIDVGQVLAFEKCAQQPVFYLFFYLAFDATAFRKRPKTMFVYNINLDFALSLCKN